MRTKLKIFRISRRLNQRQMAARLGYARAYYGHVERGFQDGSAAFWERLQSAFRLTDDEVQELKTID
jgi:transcriptional regulator with XRE-family HTH domain